MQFPEHTEPIDLQPYWFILKRRWLPASAVLGFVILLTASVTSVQKPDYEAQGKLMLKRANTTSTLTGLGREIGELDSLGQQDNPVDTEVEVIRSVPILQKTIAALNLKNKQGKPLKPKELQKQLTVKSIKGTDVMELSHKSTAPKEAAAVINKVMNFYLENNLHTNRAEAVAARKFIEEQLPKTKDTVRQAEAALRSFKERNRIVALQEEAKSAVAVIADLDSQMAKAQVELTKANARSAALQNQLGMNAQQSVAINSLTQSPGVQKVLEDFQAVESQLARERSRFQEEAPVIVNLKSKEAFLKDLLQKRIKQVIGDQQQSFDGNLQTGELQQKLTEEFVKSEVERFVLTNQLTALTNIDSSYKQRAYIIPQLEQTQRDLEREVEAAQSTYETLLKKLQEVQVAENQNMGNVRIIEAAEVPEKPSGGKKAVVTTFGGLLLGILLSATTVIVLEVRDTSIKTLKEARELFGYTLLGTIPLLGKKVTSRSRNLERTVPALPVRDSPRSPISAMYRMLQANLKFLSSDKTLKVIVVTSSVSKEGKSTVSANLAAAIAQVGRRVLLVDADMYHPSQHHIWELTNAAGLSDVIVNQADFSAVVEGVMANLDVLPTGVMPPNPLALLDSKRMASLVEYFSENYDFVIIDAPPLVIAADALTLGKMTDGVLFVARPEVVERGSAAAAKESLERSGQNVLGLVINGVILENESDSYFYYKKGYYVEEDSTTSEKVISRTRKNTERS
jgi:capsular exopolysaccharide synthesis family protein